MLPSSFNGLELLNVWAAPTEDELASFMANTLLQKKSEENDLPFQLYFIDATNSFPLKSFQRVIPVSEESKIIYDNIRIITCLDLEEVSNIITKLTELILSSRATQIARQQHTKGHDGHVSGILLIISGLEIMFRNSQLKEAAISTHTLLNNTLLKIRTIANNGVQQEADFKALLTFPSQELDTYLNLNKAIEKRSKKPTIKGNTVGAYIAKFYTDTVFR